MLAAEEQPGTGGKIWSTRDKLFLAGGVAGTLALLAGVAAIRGKVLYKDWTCGFRNCVIVKR